MIPKVVTTETPAARRGKGRAGGERLSVTIVAQDEERTIASVLEAVQEIADEVVFLDSGSSDRTPEIARRFGVRFYHQPWLGYAAQKNLAIDYAEGPWILSLDADEILTPQLVAEIKQLFCAGMPSAVNGFKIPRLLYIGDTPVRRGGFYPDAQLRLIRKGSGRFRQRIVHEAISVEGQVKLLSNHMLHYSYKDVQHFAQAMDKYARLSAQHYFEKEFKPWRASRLNELLHPWWTLFFRQVLRGGFLEGRLTFQLNWIYADYVRKKISYLRKLVADSK